MTDADRAAGAPTVLVADDEQFMRELVVTLLEMDGYRVLQAETGAGAIALVEECSGKIDLLIADVMMPEMTGPQAAAQIHAQHPGIPVILLTGQNQTSVQTQGLDGADVELLEKPFETGELRHRVRTLIDGSATR